MDRRCIVVCDSGIGGLGLYNMIAKKLKGQTVLYYADFDNLPYGSKSKEELEKIAEANFKKFMPFCPKTVVFACNTLSTNTITKEWAIGVETVRVLPKVKERGKGLLLSTEATAKSDYVKELKSANSRLDVMPLSGFAEEIEKHALSGEEIDLEKRFVGICRDYDFVSLGCTHYPLVVKKFKKIFPFSEFLSGEDDVFDKIVFSVTTFDTLDHHNEVCFIGKGAERAKSLYFNGIFDIR